ncbi:MAG: NADH-quinone oxidoreductase subunit NuoH [Phycisphaerales bacterium]|nr:NADH-quinone oxidoreductase subunit NuoH [Phycisphaerales bacterium]
MPTTLIEQFGNPAIAIATGVGGVMTVLSLNALFLIWLERKVSAWIQRRMGPMEVGFHGVFQTIADMLKLLGKQLITPKGIDKPLYHLAPIVVFAPVVAATSLLPFSKSVAISNIDIGLVLIFVFGGFAVVGIFMAGWGSNNKYALLGAMRSVAQNISYEIPLILSALAVVLMVSAVGREVPIDGEIVALNGLNLAHITMAQVHWTWFILVQPVAALIYFISVLAETNRAPFDIPEAESELVAGFHTEYSGMRFALFFFAEFSNMFIGAMVATVLFLGGWEGPILPGPVWFFLKTYALIFIMMWVRWTYPRLRFDQLMTFCWAILIPLSILNLLVTALVIKVVQS